MYKTSRNQIQSKQEKMKLVSTKLKIKFDAKNKEIIPQKCIKQVGTRYREQNDPSKTNQTGIYQVFARSN